MIIYNSNNINECHLGGRTNAKVYLNGALCYQATSGDVPPTPTAQTPCYAVVDNISQYSSTDFEDVFNNADDKWYKLNNLTQYEEYGVFGSGRTITTYEGKLTIDDDYEYQYSGGTWNNVGEVSGGGVTTSALTSNFNRSLPITQCIVDITDPQGSGYYFITFSTTPNYTGSTASITSYSICPDEGKCWINGTAKQLSSLPQAEGYASNYRLLDWGRTVYFAGGEQNAPFNQVYVQYAEEVEYPMYYPIKQDPPTSVTFATMEEALEYQCPYVGLHATIGGELYFFNEQYQWELIQELKFQAYYSDDTTFSAACNSSDELSTSDTHAHSSSYDFMLTAVIGDCVTTIGDYAFQNCGGLNSLEIPNSVTSIGDNAFDGCTSLESIGLVGSGASIEIPSSVTSIGNEAFRGCTSLTSIVIPNSVTSIGYGAFQDCSGLTSITIEATTPPILGYGALDNTNDCPIYVPCNCVDDYKMYWREYENRITCKSCSEKLCGIDEFGNEFTIFDDGTDELTQYDDIRMYNPIEATVGNVITNIGNQAFMYCSSLTSITIPNSVTSIGGYAFQDCYSLQSITIEATTPPSLGESAFDNANDCTIYVPEESLMDYWAEWGEYEDRIKPIGYDPS